MYETELWLQMKNRTDFILIYRFNWAKLNTIRAHQSDFSLLLKRKGEQKKKKKNLIGYKQINYSRILIVIKLRFLSTQKLQEKKIITR